MEDRTSRFLAEIKDTAGDVVRSSRPAELLASGGAVRYARTMWAYSAASRILGMKDYLYEATEIKDYFLEHFMDHKYGGVYASINPRGEREDIVKKADVIAAGIFGLSEYAGAAHDDSTLRQAHNLFLYMEKYLHVEEVYVEAKSRDWEQTLSDGTVSFNTMLHILEAYVNLYKVGGNDKVRQATADLLNVLADKVQSVEGISYNSYFSDWTVADKGWNYGHQLSLGWLFIYAAYTLGDIDLVNKLREKALLSVKAGLTAGRQEDGSVFKGQDAEGAVNSEKTLWIQAEALIASLFVWKYNACNSASDKALQTWKYIKSEYPEMNGDLYHSVRLATLVRQILK